METGRGLKGNDCNTCQKRFECLTSKERLVCPILMGEDIHSAFPFHKNVAVCISNSSNSLWQDCYRIGEDELVKLLKRAKFRIKRKYGCNFLKVIDDNI